MAVAAAFGLAGYVWFQRRDEAPGDAQLLQLDDAEHFERHPSGAGEHGPSYWREHIDEYLRFYVEALKRCT